VAARKREAEYNWSIICGCLRTAKLANSCQQLTFWHPPTAGFAAT
jgi:hypothetical protein